MYFTWVKFTCQYVDLIICTVVLVIYLIKVVDIQDRTSG